MPKKIIVTTILFLLALPVYFQVTRANAEDEPLTPPVTSEVTPTTTPTVTPTNIPTATPTVSLTPTVTPTPTEVPDEEGSIQGKVIYRKLGPVPHNTPRASDAAGVDVLVENFFGGGEVASDTTDTHGMYVVDVPPGFYKVTVEDETSAFFTPPFRFVRVNEDQTRQADFQGLVFPSF